MKFANLSFSRLIERAALCAVRLLMRALLRIPAPSAQRESRLMVAEMINDLWAGAWTESQL